MTKKIREALERLEDVTSDGDQSDIKDAIAELAGALERKAKKHSNQTTLGDILRTRRLTDAAEIADKLEEGIDTAPSDGEEAEEAEKELRDLASELFGLLDDADL